LKTRTGAPTRYAAPETSISLATLVGRGIRIAEFRQSLQVVLDGFPRMLRSASSSVAPVVMHPVDPGRMPPSCSRLYRTRLQIRGSYSLLQDRRL